MQGMQVVKSLCLKTENLRRSFAYS